MGEVGVPDDPLANDELRAARARAGELAAELAVLTRERPSITWTLGGAVRVSVRVRGAPDLGLTVGLLAVLSRADRFGHRKAEAWQHVWLEIGGTPTKDEDWS
ncbi:hypothetical protein [Kitasatospora sp. NPDC004531]